MNPLSDTHAALAFTCAHQIIPEASADTDVLFKYARWLQKNNLLKQDKSVDAQTERLYRIAAENGSAIRPALICRTVHCAGSFR